MQPSGKLSESRPSQPMNTADALLRDICENPDDDTPRLVLADWLEEHGQPERAELIRVQCESARLSPEHSRQKRLQKRTEELLKEHALDWAETLPWPKGVQWCEQYKYFRGGYHRGFVSQATFSSARAF